MDILSLATQSLLKTHDLRKGHDGETLYLILESSGCWGTHAFSKSYSWVSCLRALNNPFWPPPISLLPFTARCAPEGCLHLLPLLHFPPTFQPALIWLWPHCSTETAPTRVLSGLPASKSKEPAQPLAWRTPLLNWLPLIISSCQLLDLLGSSPLSLTVPPLSPFSAFKHQIEEYIQLSALCCRLLNVCPDPALELRVPSSSCVLPISLGVLEASKLNMLPLELLFPSPRT